jgi:hypothetical protein
MCCPVSFVYMCVRACVCVCGQTYQRRVPRVVAVVEHLLVLVLEQVLHLGQVALRDRVAERCERGGSRREPAVAVRVPEGRLRVRRELAAHRAGHVACNRRRRRVWQGQQVRQLRKRGLGRHVLSGHDARAEERHAGRVHRADVPGEAYTCQRTKT